MHGFNGWRWENIKIKNIVPNGMTSKCLTFCVSHLITSIKTVHFYPHPSPNLKRPIYACDMRGMTQKLTLSLLIQSFSKATSSQATYADSGSQSWWQPAVPEAVSTGVQTQPFHLSPWTCFQVMNSPWDFGKPPSERTSCLTHPSLLQLASLQTAWVEMKASNWVVEMKTDHFFLDVF